MVRKDAGEARNTIPGSSVELESEFDPWWATSFDDGEEDSPEWRTPFIIKITDVSIYLPPQFLAQRYRLKTDYLGRDLGSRPPKSF